MNVWFIVYLCIQAMSIGLNLAKHREPKDGEYNFITSLIGAVIGTLIVYMAIKVGF